MINTHQFNSCSTNSLPFQHWVVTTDQTYFRSWVQQHCSFPGIDVSRHIVTSVCVAFDWPILRIADGGPTASATSHFPWCGLPLFGQFCLQWPLLPYHLQMSSVMGSTWETVSLFWPMGCLWIGCTWASANYLAISLAISWSAASGIKESP